MMTRHYAKRRATRRRISEEHIEPLIKCLVEKRPRGQVLKLSFKRFDDETKWYAVLKPKT